MSSRGRESTKLCGNFALYITSIIMMLITILLMIEDRRNISCANNTCYVHISFLKCNGNACKTNSVIYFNLYKTFRVTHKFGEKILRYSIFRTINDVPDLTHICRNFFFAVTSFFYLDCTHKDLKQWSFHK